MSSRSRTARRDEGTAALEFVALYPLLIVIALFVLQAGAAMWTVSATNEAARTAARAASLGEDARAAAEGSLPDAMRIVPGGFATSTGTSNVVRLEVSVPRVSPLPRFTVTREAVLP